MGGSGSAIRLLLPASPVRLVFMSLLYWSVNPAWLMPSTTESLCISSFLGGFTMLQEASPLYLSELPYQVDSGL